MIFRQLTHLALAKAQHFGRLFVVAFVVSTITGTDLGFANKLIADQDRAKLDADLEAACEFSEIKNIVMSFGDKAWSRKDVASDQNIKDAIKTMYVIDQVLRQQVVRNGICAGSAKGPDLQARLFGLITTVDIENTLVLKAILAKRSWNDIRELGGSTERETWAIVQHARFSYDLSGVAEFQRSLLPDIANSVLLGTLDRWHYAATFDRVAIDENRPQLWGTQLTCIDGHFRPINVFNESDWKRRRSLIGDSQNDEDVGPRVDDSCVPLEIAPTQGSKKGNALK